MSAEATGWVFKSSPYSGAMFTLHLAIADIVNDTHRNELWASVRLLGEKARISERSVRSGLARMVQDGLLELLVANDGHVRRYRFLMPSDPGNHCTPATVAPLQPDAQTPANERQTPANERQTPATVAPYPKETQENSTGSSQTLLADIRASHQHHPADRFDEFWSVFPNPKSKGTARTAWTKALKKASADEIIAGVHRYLTDERVLKGYIQHPATWLNGEGWNDERTVPRRKRPKGFPGIEAALAQHTPQAMELT